MTKRLQRTLLLSLLYFATALSYAQKLPVEAFASPPDIQNIKLSPAGDRLLLQQNYSVDSDAGTLITLYDLSTNERRVLISSVNEKYKIRWASWVDNEHVIISAIFPDTRYGVPTTETRLLVKSLKDDSVKNVLPRSFYSGLIQLPQFQDNVIAIVPEERSIFLSINRDTLDTFVFKIDVETRKRKKIQASKVGVRNWIADQQHNVRVGLYHEDTEYRLYVKGPKKRDKLNEVHRFEAFSKDQVWPLGFGNDPHILYVRAYHKGKFAIFTTDIRLDKLDLKLIYADENFDVDGDLIYSPVTKNVVGVYHSEGDGNVYFDDGYKGLQNGLNKALPDTSNYIIDVSQNEDRYIAVARNETHAGTYYYGNRKTKQLAYLGDKFKALKPELMAAKNHFSYEARDGQKISAYLTLPKNHSKDKSLPTLIFPHGGPISYDNRGFDYWTQFFANRGYAVFQMNFRGSAGYGYDFMKAGLQNWGKIMQDDVEDGTRELISQGIADPERVCIVGASYGGYAALMGSAKTPDLYQCAISFAGVSDVYKLVRSHFRYTNYEIVKDQIGDSRRALKAVSPIELVDNIKVPILLIHGTKDRSVRFSQSKSMYKALKKRDKAVEFVELENGDHYLTKHKHRVATFKAIDDFLAIHLPVKIESEDNPKNLDSFSYISY